MPKLRIYLDTSVISHLFHDDAPERKSATLELFENAIDIGAYHTFISKVVLDELIKARDSQLRAKLLDAAARPALDILPSDDPEVVRMAAIYMRQNVLSPKNPEDALHVAYATVYEMDVLVTWNFRHLARARTGALVAGLNRMEGYSKLLQILTPLEVLVP